MKRVNKAEKALERFAARTGMSEHGLNWLKVAIDPFHDGEIRLCGFPDGVTQASLCQMYKMSRTITIDPATFPNGADMLIRTDGFLSSVPASVVNAAAVGALVTTPNPSNAQFGGLDIRYAKSGLSLVNPAFSTNLFVPNTTTVGSLRVLAAGFEVHNLTPELYKGGAITVFRQPQSCNTATQAVWNNASPTAVLGSFTFNQTEPVPRNEAAALLLNGSQSWEAKDGCYCVATFSTKEVAPMEPAPTAIIETVDYLAGVRYDSFYPTYYPGNYQAQIATGTSFTTTGPLMNYSTRMNSAGAYLTGLPVQSVIKINYNVVLERFPNATQTELSTLAQARGVSDPVALEAYSEIMKMMPVGVPVIENGIGDWFLGGVSSLVDHLSGTSIASNLLKGANEWVGLSSPPAETRRIQPQNPTVTEVVKETVSAPRMPVRSVQGPLLPNGKFASVRQQQRNKKKRSAKKTANRVLGGDTRKPGPHVWI